MFHTDDRVVKRFDGNAGTVCRIQTLIDGTFGVLVMWDNHNPCTLSWTSSKNLLPITDPTFGDTPDALKDF